jgi:hypothetical protein
VKTFEARRRRMLSCTRRGAGADYCWARPTRAAEVHEVDGATAARRAPLDALSAGATRSGLQTARALPTVV